MSLVGTFAWSLILLAPGPQVSPASQAKLEGDLATLVANAAPGKFLPVDIILTTQAPRSAIAAAAALPDKRERREVVKRVLKDTAAQSQGGLIQFLEQRRATGEVRGEIRSLWIHNIISVEVSPGVALELADREDVALVHHDPPRGEEVLLSAPASPTAGGNPTCGLNLIRAPETWTQTGITGQGVVVGVIDTGICGSHMDILGQQWTNPCEIANNNIDDDQNGFIDDTRGWNFESNNKNTADNNGHGSHVAGTVAGDGTAGTQCGVAPDARVMALKFFNDLAGEASVWNCMQYGVDNNADILTASLGWAHAWGPQRATWRAVCDNTIAAGVVVIYAAGNEGCGGGVDNVRTPGDVPDVITVGAVTCSDGLASFSSCGPVTWQNIPPYNDHPFPPGLTKPDVSAPGDGTVSHSMCSGYTTLSGTSMATPHVAGLSALLLQADPTLDHFGVKALLEGTSIDRGVAGKDNQFGSGRVDALNAVQAALANGNFCTAKASSCGTTPQISATGTPSASANSGFVVRADGMRGAQFGMLTYTDAGPNNAPFLGGNLCIQGVNRTVILIDTTGTPGFCDGVLTIDMNSFRAGLLGGPVPLPALSTPGSTIHAQFFGRDPGNSFNAVLTGGFKYVVCP